MSIITIRKSLAGCGGCLSTFFGFCLLITLIGHLTHSGLGGICGPYGSDTATSAMLALLALAFIVSPWVGIRTERMVARKIEAEQPKFTEKPHVQRDHTSKLEGTDDPDDFGPRF